LPSSDRVETSASWAALDHEQRYRVAAGGGRVATDAGSSRNILGPFRRRLIATDLSAIVTATLLALALSARASSSAINPYLVVYSMPFAIAGG
jgi:hypothetical protein